MLEVSFGFFWGGQASVSGFPLPARSECQAILARRFRPANCWLIVSE